MAEQRQLRATLEINQSLADRCGIEAQTDTTLRESHTPGVDLKADIFASVFGDMPLDVVIVEDDDVLGLPKTEAEKAELIQVMADEVNSEIQKKVDDAGGNR